MRCEFWKYVGNVSQERMIGSWAGAMGHLQFMPSTFLSYAKDVDGDDAS